MKIILGLVLMLLGILLGLYIGFYVLLFLGIVQVVNALQTIPIDAHYVGIGTMKILLAMPVGAIICGVFFAIGRECIE